MTLASLNSEYFKYFLILITAPLWWPFLKALYAELNDALASEGGLFGRTPSKDELRKIERDPTRAKSPLTSAEFPDAVGRASPSAGSARSAPVPGGRTRGSAGGAGFSRPRGGRGFSRKDSG